MADYKIAPSILSEDFARLGEEVTDVLNAGADIVLLECVPNEAGKLIRDGLEVPVIGIGAGPDVVDEIGQHRSFEPHRMPLRHGGVPLPGTDRRHGRV